MVAIRKTCGAGGQTEPNCNLQTDTPAGVEKAVLLVWGDKLRASCPASMLMMGFGPMGCVLITGSV